MALGTVETTLPRDIPTQGALPFSHTRVLFLIVHHDAATPANAINAGKTCTVPFRFVIPEHVSCAEFGLPQLFGDDLKRLQSVLPPSFDPSTDASPLAKLRKQFGRVIYSVSAVVDGSINGKQTMIRQGERQIQFKPRPSLDFGPFISTPTAYPLKTKWLRRRLGTISLEPITTGQGLHCVGTLTGSQSNFSHEIFLMVNPEDGPAMVLVGIEGRLVMKISYSAVPILSSGQYEMEQEQERKVFSLKVAHSAYNPISPEQSYEQFISIAWELKTPEDIAPSFNTLLISRSHELQFRLRFKSHSGQNFLPISLRVPTTLSVRPSGE